MKKIIWLSALTSVFVVLAGCANPCNSPCQPVAAVAPCATPCAAPVHHDYKGEMDR